MTLTCISLGAALTPDSCAPKMTTQVPQIAKVAMSPQSEYTAPRNLFRVIATDLHFWIPFAVLVGGLFLTG
jgi:hypothetical protein